MSNLGLNFYPPTIYFNNINFNNDFYAIPNNNQGISLAYANTHFLFSTGVANSTATSTFFSGSVGVGAIATGLTGDMNALKYLLNGNNISNIFVSSNVLSNTSNTLNTKIDTKQDKLTADTSLLGNGSNITNITYGNIVGTPNLNLYVPFTALASSNYITNSTTGLLNYYNKTETDTILNSYVSYSALASSNYITNSTSGLSNYYNKTETNTLLNAKEAVLTFNAPLTRTENTIDINLNSYVPFNALASSNYALSNSLNTKIDNSSNDNYIYSSNLNNKFNIVLPSNKFWYDGINSLYCYDLNIEKYIISSNLGGGYKSRSFRISTLLPDADWRTKNNLLMNNEYINNPDVLTIHMNNNSNYLGISTPNDNYTNGVILGKTKDTNVGYWNLVPNNYNYIRYITKVGWTTNVIIERLLP